MPSITINNLSWSTPDNRPVLAGLDLSFSEERAGLIGRNGVGKSTLLRLITGDLRPASGRIAVNGTIAVLRQSVQVSPDEAIADLFGAADALAVLDRAEAGEADAGELAAADWTLASRIESALAETGLHATAETPLASLSGGQRTRAALAALIFANPDFLLLDEPTNNLDRAGRDALIALLGRWRKGAIVVSHDRELLERMDAIVELTSLGAARYGGGWSAYAERKTLELAAAEQELAGAERRVAQAKRSAQVAVERQARRDGRGARTAAKGGMPKIVAGAMKRTAEETRAAGSRLATRIREDAQTAASDARARIETLEPMTVALASTGLPDNRTVLCLSAVTAGYDPANPVLRDVSLTVIGPERLAIAGPNGSGKTTLLGVITGRIAPFAGEVQLGTDFAMLDQRVRLLDPGATIAENFARLNPAADHNECRAALARFRFRADAALQIVESLSGGQMLRAGLACVLGGRTPRPLLILDEPTNHLDLDSIAAVEAGLSAYDGALIVVSHDAAFLEAIGITRTFHL